ncbi:helix-turn-helix domain-containing protein [Streptomyces noursei]
MTDHHEPDDNQPDPRVQFGEELKSARELYGTKPMTQVQAARKLNVSAATVSRIERADGSIPEGVPAQLDELFATDGTFKRLHEAIVQSAYREYAQRSIELEERAIEIAAWSPTVLPGLLQTKGYAHALLRAGAPRASDAEVNRGVRNRLARQAILSRSNCPDLSVVVCESVIRRHTGTADVMRNQLGTLLSHAGRPTTRLQVLPLDSQVHGLMDGPLTVLTMPDGVTVAYTEGIQSGTIIEDPSTLRRLRRAYDGVTASALSAEASASLIRRCMEEL